MRLNLPLGLTLVSLVGCNTANTDYDFFDSGPWAGDFIAAQQTLTLGDGTETTEQLDLRFEGNAQPNWLGLEDSQVYCASNSEDGTSQYPYLCGYVGPTLIFVFEGDQLYAGQPGGSIAGPASPLEAYGQYVPRETFEQEGSTATPTPTPGAGEDGGGESPPSEGYRTVQAELTCTRVVNHWMYGQLLSRQEMHTLLRVTELVDCEDASGVAVPSASSTLFIEAEGVLALQP